MDGSHGELAGQYLAPGLHTDRQSVLASPPQRSDFAKRAVDATLSLGILLVALPAFLVLALLVRLDGGPAFYAHRRVGRNGREFGCLKFRSMVPDAERRLREVLAADPAMQAEWQQHRKLRHDPRITRVGRFLRMTSLDELPQLLNVLRGDMSLVGPRPVVWAELRDQYGAEGTAAYLSVRPGLTGAWQVSGRSSTGYEERVRLDMAYVRNQSFWADCGILFRTFGAVLRRRGAY